MRRKFILSHQHAREAARQAVLEAQDGYAVIIEPQKRNLEQNAKFHSICGELAKKAMFYGKRRSPEDWKVLLVSAHHRSEGAPEETVLGIEGEVVILREATSAMSKDRMSSLIEYAQAYLSSL